MCDILEPLDAIHDIGTRDIIHDEDNSENDTNLPPIRKVNLIHRLDRGASGALLLTYASSGVDGDESDNGR